MERALGRRAMPKVVAMGVLSWLPMLMAVALVLNAEAFILNSELRATSQTTSFLAERVFSDVEGFMQFPDDQITTSSKWAIWMCFAVIIIKT